MSYKNFCHALTVFSETNFVFHSLNHMTFWQYLEWNEMIDGIEIELSE